MNKSVVYLFVSIFFLFISCEYQLGENFMDFEKRQVDSVAMSVDFYGPFIHDVENGTFVVENSGDAVCQIDPLPGFEIEKQIIRLGEMVWESNGTQCDFRLDVDLIPNGSYELSCEIIARMNSGTVAGQVGIEHYVEKRSWPLKVNDGFDHYRIEFTTLKKGANYIYTTRRSDFDIHSYADKRYAGEKGTYKVYLYFKAEADRPRSLGSLDLEQAKPQVQVEYRTKNRVRLSWTYPYRSAVDVVYGGEVVAEKVTDGMTEFPLAGQEAGMVELRFSPVDNWGYENANYTFNLENYPKR